MTPTALLLAIAAGWALLALTGALLIGAVVRLADRIEARQ